MVADGSGARGGQGGRWHTVRDHLALRARRFLLSVVAGAGALLMPASPHRPAQPVGTVTDGVGEQGREQVLDLVAGDTDQLGRWGGGQVMRLSVV